MIINAVWVLRLGRIEIKLHSMPFMVLFLHLASLLASFSCGPVSSDWRMIKLNEKGGFWCFIGKFNAQWCLCEVCDKFVWGLCEASLVNENAAIVDYSRRHDTFSTSARCASSLYQLTLPAHNFVGKYTLKLFMELMLHRQFIGKFNTPSRAPTSFPCNPADHTHLLCTRYWLDAKRIRTASAFLRSASKRFSRSSSASAFAFSSASWSSPCVGCMW